tara:strand:- start:1741 stop:2037 length:297 start_codon:yes stop_codon:yes gene_type:complete
MPTKTKTLTIELTAEEFGALAGAVSTEWQKRMEEGNRPASRYISIRLQDAWMKVLRAWHGPESEDGMLASSDWVTLFQPNPATSDGEEGLIAEVFPIR